MSTDTLTKRGESAQQRQSAKDTNILFVTRTGEYGGAEKHLLDLIIRLNTLPINIRILCLGKDFYSERINQSNRPRVHITRRCYPQSRGIVSSWLQWRHIISEFNADIVVFVNGGLWAFPSYISIVAWAVGIPKRIFIAHLTPPHLPQQIKGWSPGGVVRRLRRITHLLAVTVSSHFYAKTICVSESIRKRLISDYRFGVENTITIHNGVSLAEFEPSSCNAQLPRARLGISRAEFVVVCAARLCKQKRIDVLLLALQRVIYSGLRCKCIIVGEGPLKEELQEQACTLGVTEHVVFEGFQKDIRPYLGMASVFMLTSDAEGLPLSILEAMACGVPCLVTDVGGNAEVVAHGRNGLVVRPDSADAVAEGLAYLIRHPVERQRMSNEARERAKEAFDIEASMTKLKRAIFGRHV